MSSLRRLCVIFRPSVVILTLLLLASLPSSPAGLLFAPPAYSDPCSEQLPPDHDTPSKLTCAIFCLRTPNCAAFTHTAGRCRLFSGAPEDVEGVLSRVEKAVPTGYSPCGDQAYRVIGPRSRSDVLLECAQVPGGKLGLPLGATQRQFVSQLVVKRGQEIPASQLRHLSAALLEGTMENTGGNVDFRSDYNGAAMNIPLDIFANLGNAGKRYYIVIDSSSKLWPYDGAYSLMSVCEVPLVSE